MNYYRIPNNPNRKPESEQSGRGSKSFSKGGKVTATQGGRYVVSVIGTTFLTLFLIIVITICVVAVALTVYITQFADTMYDIDLRDFELNYSSFVFARNPDFDPDDEESEEYIEILQLSADENRIWVYFENVPQHTVNALISTEDRRFFEHAGVDWTRTVYIAVNEMLLGGMDRMQGGSTITQQLVRDATGDNDVNVGRKLREIFRALTLEQSYSKHDILESYFNRVAFGPTIYGIGSAARHYFDKEAWELTIAESAILIGLLPSPVAGNPYSNAREARIWQGNVLYNMLDQGFISYPQYREAVDEQVQFRLPISPICRCPEDYERCDGAYFGYIDERWEEFQGLQTVEDPNTDLYFRDTDIAELVDCPFTWTGYEVTHNWYVDAALKMITADLAELFEESHERAALRIRQGGLSIYLSKDIEMQARMEEAFLNPNLISSRRYPPGTPARDTLQGGFVLMDMQGNVVALAGGVGDKMGNDVFNRAIQSRRHIGSAVKPFAVYGPAVDLGVITYSTMLLDSPGRIDDPDRQGQFLAWPMNFGNNPGSGGGQSAHRAMAVSTNTTAARTLHMMGVRTAFNFVTERLQVELEPRHMDFSPLAGGAMEVRLHEVAAAYQIFGTGGVFYRPAFYSRVVDRMGNVILEKDYEGEQVIGADSAWVVNRMMWHVLYTEGGTGHAARMGHIDAVGKTGTANAMTDVVFGGLTPDFVGVVRMGFDDNRYMRTYSGGIWRRPALVWREVMQAVIPTNQPRTFDDLRAASGTQRMRYCTSSGLRAGGNCAGSRYGYYTADNIPPVCPCDDSVINLQPRGSMEHSPLYRA